MLMILQGLFSFHTLSTPLFAKVHPHHILLHREEDAFVVAGDVDPMDRLVGAGSVGVRVDGRQPRSVKLRHIHSNRDRLSEPRYLAS